MVSKSNTDGIEPSRLSKGETEFSRWKLGEEAGCEDIGCSIYELLPGKASFPYHYHSANEEAIYVLEGTGSVRGEDEELDIGEGDFVALPAGADGAHKIRNTSDEPLRYMMISTMNHPDVLIYPDSDKIGVFTGSPPGGSKDERALTKYFPADSNVDYWKDEE